MKLFKNTSMTLVALMTLAFALSANAITYHISDAATNCSNSPHGLWTGRDIGGGSCSNYFSIDGFLTVNTSSSDSSNWFAALEATAVNAQGVVADIDINFTDWADDHLYKRENGAPYNPAAVDFFTTTLGTITIGNSTYDIDAVANGYAFQYGMGANAKNPNTFGASAWVQSCQNGVDGACMNSHHWDLNLDLNPVPIPGALLLFGSALLGLGAVKRKNKIAA